MRLLRHLLVPLLAVVLAAACGDGGTREGAVDLGTLDGPPRWRLVTERSGARAQAAMLHVRTPVRVRLRHAGSDILDQETPWRALAAGQTLEIRWSHNPVDLEARPAPEDAAAGRSEALAVQTEHHFADRVITHDRLLRFARPGHGSTPTAMALPPGRYEELPMPGTVELMTIVLADVDEGEPTLRRREGRTVLVPPAGMGEDDRMTTWRLFLDIEALTD